MIVAIKVWRFFFTFSTLCAGVNCVFFLDLFSDAEAAPDDGGEKVGTKREDLMRAEHFLRGSHKLNMSLETKV